MNTSSASPPTPNLELLRKAIQEYQPNPSRVPFSNLKPFHDFIVALRGKKASYAVIADLLQQNGVKTSRARVAEYGRIVLDGGKKHKRRRQRRIILPPTPPIMPPARQSRKPAVRWMNPLYFRIIRVGRVLPASDCWMAPLPVKKALARRRERFPCCDQRLRILVCVFVPAAPWLPSGRPAALSFAAARPDRSVFITSIVR